MQSLHGKSVCVYVGTCKLGLDHTLYGMWVLFDLFFFLLVVLNTLLIKYLMYDTFISGTRRDNLN